ncbi:MULTISPECIES: formylmethanofuran dehydrogenase subunit B [unclassified Hyphomicrobium]|uniref:formylmethanofuran dehydrogenase subunit B n=1 Tax=unclassified Hyphomicrobium TaxID=2619925 RepID=UPI000213DAD4|nr:MULTISPECIES: formylmethanofuran dehydrogenase subunit B [unclassified Hyphomicrobium]CCB65111.1 Formylmethanofuran dehydrogenase subunit B [Hyphomicrobium sp. MC1]
MESEKSRNGANHFENVACPFCGILCDDLDIGPSGDGLKVLKNGCVKSVAGFERPLSEPKPQINGKDVTLDEAVAAAARLINESRLPIFGGLGTDVDGIRAAIALAEKGGGIVDHALSDGQYRNFRVLQSTGWVLTTLTEARNRADLFIVAGSDIHQHHPRFFERIVCNEASMFADDPPKRTVVFLGDQLDQSAVKGKRIGEVLSLPVEPDRIAEILDAMRAMNKGGTVSGDSIGDLPRAAVEDLLARCKAASYGVIIWAPPSLTFPNADLTVQAISEFVKEINLTSRFAGLSLGGHDGATSAGAVCSWQSGFPLRVSYASGKPDYDPERYSANRLLAAKEGDLLLWLSSFSSNITEPETDVPTIFLGAPGIKPSRTPKVYIPVGTPGVDHAGTMVRVDNVVSLPLRQLRQSTLPRAADVLEKIEAAL